ncbi:MAG: translation elongation factor Ts [Pseudanabaenaceae cyanobacterium bins.68]|nr:translation elongation factor Ts [Pseudanabaenaceae cyanobacterium bins.68]
MAEISTAQVQDLRAKTGAGIKDCKKALQESDGDAGKAAEWLRQKGLASAIKKAGRAATEGIVRSYIHFGDRIGVLVEINCETDFVARREEMKDLADNIAKQIAACPNVEYVSVDQIPASFVEKEKAIEAGKDDLASKPEAMRANIVKGRVDKRLKEISLLDQLYIKDQNKTVDDLVKETAIKLSENIKISRFVRFVVGEGQDEPEVSPIEQPQTPAIEPEVPAQPSLSAEVLSQVQQQISAIEQAIATLKQSLPSEPALSESASEPATDTSAPAATKAKAKKK